MLQVDSLLETHAILMQGLIEDAGSFRRSSVVVGSKERVVHIGPSAERVPDQIRALFAWLLHTEPRKEKKPPYVRSTGFVS